MSLNPLGEELEASAARIDETRRRRQSLVDELAWHAAFDRVATAETVQSQVAASGAWQEERVQVDRNRDDLQRQVQRLEAKARLGLRPTYWLSRERRSAKSQLKELEDRSADLQKERKRLARLVNKAGKAAQEAAEALERFDQVDVAATRAAVGSADTELALLQIDHERLARRKEDLDQRLREPAEVLLNLKSEQHHAAHRRDALRSRIRGLEREIEQADSFDRRLSSAATPYERRVIHEECERALGDGKPRSAAGSRRRELRDARREEAAAEAALDSLTRNVKKAEDRVSSIVRAGVRDVQALVVDGSNLCYQSGTFIGLAALRPLVRSLSRSYDVTVVFDASIKQKLTGTSERALRDAFPGAAVHVVAARTQADETILAAAQDAAVYVLSNDRFAEFGEKAPVKDGRLITHEIINGQVLVRDLDIKLSFHKQS